MRLLRKCKCSYTIHTSKESCEKCSSTFRSAYPPRFSPYDKYADYRRKMKELAKQREVGLL
ncbi:MAG: nucleolar RNA-binding Nop10p family protein [Candidatus Hodarchaeales archaeon]|jgi:rRNA maturation protein Nop10